jgi:hypothetical protein
VGARPDDITKGAAQQSLAGRFSRPEEIADRAALSHFTFVPAMKGFFAGPIGWRSTQGVRLTPDFVAGYYAMPTSRIVAERFLLRLRVAIFAAAQHVRTKIPVGQIRLPVARLARTDPAPSAWGP